MWAKIISFNSKFIYYKTPKGIMVVIVNNCSQLTKLNYKQAKAYYYGLLLGNPSYKKKRDVFKELELKFYHVLKL